MEGICMQNRSLILLTLESDSGAVTWTSERGSSHDGGQQASLADRSLLCLYREEA